MKSLNPTALKVFKIKEMNTDKLIYMSNFKVPQCRITHCTKNEVLHSGFFQFMWPNPRGTADLVTLTEEILNGKLHFLCSDVIFDLKNLSYWSWKDLIIVQPIIKEIKYPVFRNFHEKLNMRILLCKICSTHIPRLQYTYLGFQKLLFQIFQM